MKKKSPKLVEKEKKPKFEAERYNSNPDKKEQSGGAQQSNRESLLDIQLTLHSSITTKKEKKDESSSSEKSSSSDESDSNSESVEEEELLVNKRQHKNLVENRLAEDILNSETRVQ